MTTLSTRSPARSSRSLPWLAAVIAALGGCSQTPTVLPSRDFDRPTDVAFLCMGKLGDGTVTGQPMNVCAPVGNRAADPAADDAHHAFAFIPNSSSGELAVIDANSWRLVDLNPGLPAYNQAPLGAVPEQIAASDDGCRLVTANRGSCDLTLVDPSALLQPLLSPSPSPSGNGDGSPAAVAQTIVPRTGSGKPLNVAPYEVQFLPLDVTPLEPVSPPAAPTTADGVPIPPAQACGAGGTLANPAGWAPAPGGRTPWVALVTFPSCDLVALVDLPSGVIRDSAYVRPGADGAGVTLVPAGQEPVCQVTECIAGPAPPDGGAPNPPPSTSDGGIPSTNVADTPYLGNGQGLLPSGVAISPPDPNNQGVPRAYVGLANASFVVAFDVSDGKIQISSAASIYLHEGALGTRRVRLSVNPYMPVAGDPGSGQLRFGRWIGVEPDDQAAKFVDVGADRKYLYVIARDGSLRIVHVADRANEQECETNVDPLNLPALGAGAPSPFNVACYPVDPAHRRPAATGPGIRLPSLPVDVAFADITPENPEGTTVLDAPTSAQYSVEGAYGWVLTASGFVYLVNVNPVPRSYQAVVPCPDPTMAAEMCHVNGTASERRPPINGGAAATGGDVAPPFPNTMRDRNLIWFQPTLPPSSGPPRLDVPPVPSAEGPRLLNVWTVGSENNATALTTDYQQTAVFFPDRAAVTPQTWGVVWEGPMFGSPRFAAQLAAPAAPAPIDQLTLTDDGVDFCSLGVRAGDLVKLEGCIADSQCGLGRVCVLGNAGTAAAGGLTINGLCASATGKDDVVAKCGQLLSTVRRYEIVAAHPGQLALEPHVDELVRSYDLAPCDPAIQPMPAGGGADGGADGGAGADDAGGGTTAPGVGTTQCDDPSDPSAKFTCHVFAGRPRCLVPCDPNAATSACRSGRTCVNFGPSGSSCGGPNDACFCADGPPVDDGQILSCMSQLQAYQVNVGRGFLVAGSQTTLPALGRRDPPGGDPRAQTCVPDQTLSPRVVARIPIDAPRCTNLPADVATWDSTCNPQLAGTDPKDIDRCRTATKGLLSVAYTTPAPQDPCLFIGGPNETDPHPATGTVTHVNALFRNTELSFVVTNLEKVPTNFIDMRFEVHGGFRPEFVQFPGTVQVSMPARIVVGPFDTEKPPAVVTTFEMPYLFVVDQRRVGNSTAGGPTRGQLLRIHPFSYTGNTGTNAGAQPIYEDFSASGNLFPIQ